MSPILKNSVHEISPFESVHEKSPTLKNSVHEMSLSTKCLHPILGTQNQFDENPQSGSKLPFKFCTFNPTKIVTFIRTL